MVPYEFAFLSLIFNRIYQGNNQSLEIERGTQIIQKYSAYALISNESIASAKSANSSCLQYSKYLHAIIFFRDRQVSTGHANVFFRKVNKAVSSIGYGSIANNQLNYFE